MKIRSRIILSFCFIVSLGFYYLVGWIVSELRPRYMESVEAVLVDTSQTLASLAAIEAEGETLNVDSLRKTFDHVSKSKFEAKVYDFTKTNVDLRVYVTDAKGMVLFDSDKGRDEGHDYSQWRNVYLALQGRYGARTTRDDPNDSSSTVLHVSAPIVIRDLIVGTLTVTKPTSSINGFLYKAQPQFRAAGLIAALTVILLGVAISIWITRPLNQLMIYVKKIKTGTRAPLPDLGKSEIADLGSALEDMREALEGKKYVENYVQNLTHEIKSPLSAVIGASELLENNLPAEKQAVLLKNIRTETARIQNFVERMLELSALENLDSLQKIEDVTVTTLIDQVVTRILPLIERKNIQIQRSETAFVLRGDKFLLEQTLSNVLQNAVDFSANDSVIEIATTQTGSEFVLSVQDHGAGIPDYALNRVFEKFYSLQRPDTGRKSTGLGLSFVREVMELHHGQVEIQSTPDLGTTVSLKFPLAPLTA